MSGSAQAPWFALWSFREDVCIEPVAGCLILHSQWEDVSVPMPGPRVAEALRRMCLGPISLENVIVREDDREEVSRVLDAFPHLVIRSFGPDREQALISVVPISPQAAFRPAPLEAELPVRLSRFVSMSPGEREWRMESPLSSHRVLLHKAEAMALAGALGWPAFPAELPPGTRQLAECLLATGMAGQGGGEDSDPVLAIWKPLDLMFHSRALLGRHDHDVGSTARAVEPVVKPPVGGQWLDLRKPAWSALVAGDPPFSAVLEAANGTVAGLDRVPSLDDIGALLYRVARVRSLTGATEVAVATATSDRPYRSAGDCYALEIYLTVMGCEGLPDGNYHYDPLAHRLERVGDGAQELLEHGRLAANLSSNPAALLTLTARFRRSSGRFDGMSYPLLLKDAGALTQTLMLASTAMGLSTCALDSDDEELSSRALDLDWRLEARVGALVVGVRCGSGHGRTQV